MWQSWHKTSTEWCNKVPAKLRELNQNIYVLADGMCIGCLDHKEENSDTTLNIPPMLTWPLFKGAVEFLHHHGGVVVHLGSATFLVTTEANVHCAAGLFINNLWYRLMLTYFHSKLSQIFSPHHHSWVKVSKFLKNLDPAATVLSTAKACPLK